jgi:hypothetical protein
LSVLIKDVHITFMCEKAGEEAGQNAAKAEHTARIAKGKQVSSPNFIFLIYNPRVPQYRDHKAINKQAQIHNKRS